MVAFVDCVRLFSFLMQGISRLTLEMTTWSFGFNVISTEERAEPERSGEIPHGSHPTTILFARFRPLRADEGVRPYRNDVMPTKEPLYSNGIPLG